MPRRRGFTLVELLVVIGIISVLIAVLLPALAAAREQAKRVKCAANLHNMGVACMTFAAEHKGLFPAAFRNLILRSTFPMDMTTEDHGEDPLWWRKHGTSLAEFGRYGMKQQSLLCPSADSPLLFHGDPGDHNWGSGVQTNYAYVGGINPDAICPGLARWGTVPMAWKASESGAARHVLAMDLVWWGGGSGYGNFYFINHPLRRDPHRPAYQNILWGDGHVEAKTNADYPDPLSAKNYSLCHWFGVDVNYYYWSPADSAPVATHGHQMWDKGPTPPW